MYSALRKRLVGACMLVVLLAPCARAGYWNGAAAQRGIDEATGTRRTFANEVELLPEATRADAVRRRMVDEATQLINIYTLYFDKDATGMEYTKMLVEKMVASDDMEVNVIYHPLTQIAYGRSIMPLLRNAGVNTRGYLAQDTINPVKLALIGCHKKLFLTDSPHGLESVAGGRNVGGAYFDNIPEFADYDYTTGLPQDYDPENGDFTNLWRDTDIHVRGELNIDMMTDFITAFNYVSGDDEWKMSFDDERYYPELTTDAASDHHHGVEVRMLQNEPEMGLYQINEMYAHLIANARESIFIETPYFSPHQYQLDLIYDALARGVRVTILTNARDNHDIKPVYYTGLQHFKPLIKAGAEIYLWALPGVEGYTRTIHSKVVAVDDEVFMPGSWNMSGRAHDWENEYAFAITDPGLVAEGVAVLDEDIHGHGDYVIKVDNAWFRKNLTFGERIKMRFYAFSRLGYIM